MHIKILKLKRLFSLMLMLLIGPIIVLLCSFISKISTPDIPYIKQVEYDELIKTDFAISNNTILDSFEKLDVTRVRNFWQHKKVTIRIELDSSMTVINQYSEPAFNPDNWSTKVFKSISNKFGTFLYDTNDVLVYTSLNENGITNVFDDELFDLNGFGNEDSIPTYQSVISNGTMIEGYNLFELDSNRYLVSNDSIEYVFDATNQSEETRYYINDSLDNIFFERKMKLENGLYIPYQRINFSYIQLDYGGILRKAERSEISNYKINGQSLGSPMQLLGKDNSKEIKQEISSNLNIQRFSDNEIFPVSKIFVYPNPSNDFIWIQLPQIANLIDVGDLKISNSEGKLFYSESKLNFINSIKINIQNYPEGIYFIEYKNTMNQFNSKFIKL